MDLEFALTWLHTMSSDLRSMRDDLQNFTDLTPEVEQAIARLSEAEVAVSASWEAMFQVLLMEREKEERSGVETVQQP